MFGVYIGLICIMFIVLIVESQMDFNRACENIDNEYSLPWCFQNNLKLLVVQVTGALVFSIVELESFGVLGILILFGIILYCLIGKLKIVGGYAKSIFEIVEAFSFMSILVSRWETAVLHTLLLGAWIIISRIIFKDDNGWISPVVGLIEVWMVLLITIFLEERIGEHVIVLMTLFSYSILKGINLLIAYFVEKHDLEEVG